MMELTDLARDRDCEIRLPGICCFDPKTVVACHIRLPDLSGLGYKADSLFIAFGCHLCHDACDRRSHMELDREYVRLALLEGMARTQAILLREGWIVVMRSQSEARQRNV